ncbi:hypothetical protein JL720_12699 [Aureococcus anophagefferens]|nr:hypothetical protein JL720_12699 [Aureococcus anophagefferens]
MAKSGTWEEVVVRGRRRRSRSRACPARASAAARFFGGYGGGYSDETHIVDVGPAGAGVDPAGGDVVDEAVAARVPQHLCVQELALGLGVGTKGYNHAWRLQLKNDEGTEGHWLKVDAVGHVPRKRQGHTGTVVDTTFVVFIFGGFGGGCVSDFVACLEIDPLAGTASWEPPKTAGVAPSARYGSSAVTFGTSIYVFGGTGPVTGAGRRGKTDGNYVRSKVIIHSNQSKHRAPTRIFELKDINGLCVVLRLLEV